MNKLKSQEFIENSLKNLTEVITNCRIEDARKDSQIQDKNEEIKAKDKLLNQKNDKINEISKQTKSTQEEVIVLRNQIQYISEKLNSTKDQLAKYTYTENCPKGDIFFEFKIRGINTFQAWCTNEWIVIQRRYDGSENFDRPWNDYTEGFGETNNEFFFGLEKLHLMTVARTYALSIDLEYINGIQKFDRYSDFKIGSERESYYLKSLGEYSGTAGPAFEFHLHANFFTFDRDSTNCVETHGGGWWFKNCGYCMLNGNYFKNDKYLGSKFGIYWGNGTWINFDDTYTFVSMSIKP
ncbi:hypothetical protein KR032_002912 [Drosophila birchii]|nr:hypothetical protein KR032_002912 [Drosophila birchii]